MGTKTEGVPNKQSFNCLIGRQRLIREASHRERCRSAVRVYPLGMSLLTILAVFLGFSVKLQDDCVNMTWLTITRLSTQFYTVLHFYSTPIVYVRYLKFKTNVYKCEQYIICLYVCSKLQCSGGEYGTFVVSTGQAQMDCFRLLPRCMMIVLNMKPAGGLRSTSKKLISWLKYKGWN
jgi:hypothetical protein